ncbi:hypothetical protein HAX54_020120 [Datura stramonium]|uniref:F-box domain-containing protein n=1 Tax=Datura stramonium TaxID=4076 RepID=A0ABS8UTB7_DATST|nr:hypothetical protein [Datura stramonium]
MDIDILSRLPVKSLLRFRCVSKSWKALISEPYFKKKHLSHAKNPKMLISQYGYDEDHTFTFYSSSLSSIQFVTDVQRLDWPLNSKPSHARVCCCCDGLFLVGIWGNLEEQDPSILLLWNPSTRESIVLSNSELPPVEFSLYGLGYDSTINDYKVVRIDEYIDASEEILVLKSGSWKKIDESSYRSRGWLLASRYNMDGLAFVHEALHWLGCDPTDTVVSFNISNEMCGEIPLPPKAHVELRADLEKEKKKRRSRDKLIVCMWKGIKKILKALASSARTPQATRHDLPEFSFLNGFEEGADDEAGNYNSPVHGL